MGEHLDVEGILAALTLEEKAALCLGSDFWHTAPVERLGVPALMVCDGPHGLRKQPDQADHAGLGGSNPATCFPTACSLASSWNTDLVRRVGEALGRETQAEEVAVLLGPGVNIKRSPLCGRNFEYFSEDPYLSGVLGTASNASGPSTPLPDQVPAASSSRATTGLTAVCQTTHWWPYSRIDHSLSTTW